MTYNNVDALTKHLNDSPESVEFGDVIALIDSAFTFTPTAFTNGRVTNESNQNNGSCKLLALGQHLQLSQAQTLALFGTFYRDDVLKKQRVMTMRTFAILCSQAMKVLALKNFH